MSARAVAPTWLKARMRVRHGRRSGIFHRLRWRRCTGGCRAGNVVAAGRPPPPRSRSGRPVQ
jgi:hypothetical protein